MGSGHAGISLHNHAAPPTAPSPDLDDNVIIGNVISGNGADTGDAATPGPTGINVYGVIGVNGTVVAQNVISQESVGLSFKAPGQVAAYLNNFMGLPTAVGSFGAGSVMATQNYWGCSGGPSVLGCSQTSGSVTSTAWLTSPFNNTLLPGAATGGSGSSGTGTTGVTIVVAGPGGATSTTNTFQIVTNVVSLDASKSTTSNGGSLSYSWSISPGFPSASMTGGNTATPTIQLPSQGTYQFTLTVTDSKGATANTTVTIQYI